MTGALIDAITATVPEVRDRPLEALCAGLDRDELLAAAGALERFRRDTANLYQRVRALLFLHAIHRDHLPARPDLQPTGLVPVAGVTALYERRFDDAIDCFLAAVRAGGPSTPLASALAVAYRQLAFQTLADQVRRSVRSVAGNAWMFQVARAADQPLVVRAELCAADARGRRPALREATPVRMDLTHSGWSDIFFLGMDYPEGARVLNVSIDLAVREQDAAPRPPIETWFRVVDRPVLRLVSVDLHAAAEIADLGEVFDFARDHLGLLKAAVIAAGLVPPSLEGTGARLGDLLQRLVGAGRGIEVTSHVRGIPKGSRLAVSTSLLASLIALCMRATGQTGALQGPLADAERRLIVARAILGEWLGGSGGGWQDSGGLWPSIKLIEGALARPGDPEFGVSRGRLLPNHRLLGEEDVPAASLRALQESLVLVHGGLAQDVGPVLEMVTEKYLLRTRRAWRARQAALTVLDDVLAALRAGDMRALGAATQRNFTGPLVDIIPQATNRFTESLIERVTARAGRDFLGFWMLGGMSGGGMGFLFEPAARSGGAELLAEVMASLKDELCHALPFAMDPVVYDFRINEHGTVADVTRDPVPELPPRAAGAPAAVRAPRAELDHLLAAYGFDPELHEEVRADLRSGRIGLAQNRLPAATVIEDVTAADVEDARAPASAALVRSGEAALRDGSVAVVTLAAGAGTRWTHGAGVVKALHPFHRFAGRHRAFLDVHLAKSRRTHRRFGTAPLHVVSTGYLTHGPIRDHLGRHGRQDVPVLLSEGRAVGLRLVPMERDLRFLWEEMPRALLDERAQKVRESLQAALVQWARAAGEGADYRDNLPVQCLHPLGHWFEVPNLLLNGTLPRLLAARPQLTTLLLHNVDTLGAALDPGLLGRHLASGRTLTFEVIPRWIDDRGGGLARAGGRLRLLESLALPREDDEFRLTWYNSMTTWIAVDRLLELFGLTRADLADVPRVAAAVRATARRLPTYVTIKDVKKRWGRGHEDVFPTVQVEKLWSDMTALFPEDCGFLAVDRRRGQQLKDVAQLDGWSRDGSAAAIEALCDWD